GRMDWTVEVEQHVTEKKVSVRIDMDGQTFFGVAVRGNSRGEGGPDGTRSWTTLHGVSPLGERKARTSANT
ncbi:MAG TPA: hypothetical protein VFX60_12990, partial [Micromonospora sp.]|nr:hypothetical protein [Micromonospora sp.]